MSTLEIAGSFKWENECKSYGVSLAQGRDVVTGSGQQIFPVLTWEEDS